MGDLTEGNAVVEVVLGEYDDYNGEYYAKERGTGRTIYIDPYVTGLMDTDMKFREGEYKFKGYWYEDRVESRIFLPTAVIHD